MKLSLLLSPLALSLAHAYTAWDCDTQPNGNVRCVVSVTFRLASNALSDAFSSGPDIAAALSNHVRNLISQPNYASSAIVRDRGVSFWNTHGSGETVYCVVKQYYDLGAAGYYTAGKVMQITNYANDLAINYGYHTMFTNFEPNNENIANTWFQSSLGQKKARTVSHSLTMKRGEKMRDGGAAWLQKYDNWKGVPGAHPTIQELEEIEKDWTPPERTLPWIDVDESEANSTASALEDRDVLAKRGSCWYLTTSQINRAERSGQMAPTKFQNGCSGSGQTN